MKVEDTILSGIADLFKRSRVIIFYVVVGFIAIQFYEKFFPDDCPRIDNPAYQYDFRKTKWGMSPEVVKAIESDYDNSRFVKEEKDKYGESLYYEDFSHRFVTDVSYRFMDGELSGATYFLRIKNNDTEAPMIREYGNIREELTAKYGRPKKISDDIDRKARERSPVLLHTLWETPSTKISLELWRAPKDEQYYINLGYSRNFHYTFEAEEAGYYY